MTCLHPAPSAAAAIAAACHVERVGESAARITQYSASRKNIPIKLSARWTMYVTDSVCSGCTAQISAAQNASGVAADSNRARHFSLSSERRTMPEEQQRGEQVHRHVDDVIAAWICAENGVIDRERQRHNRTRYIFRIEEKLSGARKMSQ